MSLGNTVSRQLDGFGPDELTAVALFETFKLSGYAICGIKLSTEPKTLKLRSPDSLSECQIS